MKINVKQSDCKFIVKPEDRIVICKLDSVNGASLQRLVERFAHACGDTMKVAPYIYGAKADTLDMPDSFTGIARCSEQDEWDEEKGKKIAFFRVKNKFYNSFFKRANKLIEYIDAFADTLAENFDTLGESVDDNLERLREYIGEDTEE